MVCLWQNIYRQQSKGFEHIWQGKKNERKDKLFFPFGTPPIFMNEWHTQTHTINSKMTQIDEQQRLTI